MQSVFLLCFEGGESCGGENIISFDIYVEKIFGIGVGMR